MPQTIAEKILQNHALDVDGEVHPGDFIRARVDLTLLNDVNGPAAFRHFADMGGTKVASPDKLALVCDHFAPAPTAAGALLLSKMRRFAAEKGIENFFDAGKGGIEHTLCRTGLLGPRSHVGGDHHPVRLRICWAGMHHGAR